MDSLQGIELGFEQLTLMPRGLMVSSKFNFGYSL